MDVNTHVESHDYGDGGALRYRLRNIEDALKGLEDWRGEVQPKVAVQAERLDRQERLLSELVIELKNVQGSLTRLSLTIAGSAIVFGLTILAATGKIGIG